MKIEQESFIQWLKQFIVQYAGIQISSEHSNIKSVL